VTRMLASVVDIQEAETAIHAGADIIDLKNPLAGALGALPIEQVRSIVDRIAQRRPVSATIGDLPADPATLTEAIHNTAATHVDYVKVGFFSNENLDECLRSIADITAGRAIIAVLFADRNPPLDRLAEFAEAGFRGVMLDTADKQKGHLLEHIEVNRLSRFIAKAGDLELLSGLAGSLRLQDIPRLLPLNPDYLGFRGALCEHSSRVGRIESARLTSIRTAVQNRPVISNEGKVALTHDIG